MKPQALVVAYLGTLADLTAIAGTRIYEDEIPPTIDSDCVRVELIDGETVDGLDVVVPTIQVTACSKDRARAQTMGDIIERATKNRLGDMGGKFVASVHQGTKLYKDKTWWISPVQLRLEYQEG